MYPEHNWDLSRFRKQTPHLPHGHWKDKVHHREFLDQLATKLKINTPEDWYNVAVKKVAENGGKSILRYYGESLQNALKAIYPSVAWDRTKFRHRSALKPNRYWNDPLHIRQYFEGLKTTFNITHPHEWQNIGVENFKAHGGKTLVQKYGFLGALRLAYPELPWTRSMLKAKTQVHLFSMVKKLFAGMEINQNIKLSLVFAEPRFHGEHLEYDIFVPNLHLAFEYQGEQHYHKNAIRGGMHEAYRKRDQLKKEVSAARGITLIEIPYWWDRKLNSLVATILHHRPDIPVKPTASQPIPPIKPSG